MASLLTLTEADIYLAGSLLPEILLTVQILSTQLQILSTQSTKYRQMSSNIDKCQQISTNIDFNVIFPGFLTEFQGFSRISRIFLNSRVFPGFPGFPGSVDTLIIVFGTEIEIQLPLKRIPDTSVSSLIRTGWCGRASCHGKLAPIPMGG